MPPLTTFVAPSTELAFPFVLETHDLTAKRVLVLAVHVLVVILVQTVNHWSPPRCVGHHQRQRATPFFLKVSFFVALEDQMLLCVRGKNVVRAPHLDFFIQFSIPVFFLLKLLDAGDNLVRVLIPWDAQKAETDFGQTDFGHPYCKNNTSCT